MPNGSGKPLDPRNLQDRLFAALSTMFAAEVPLYGGALAVNDACNDTLLELLGMVQPGLDGGAVRGPAGRRLGAERHGAIRIGRGDEYRWVGRLFACFGMEPHGFYDMTSVGAKRQPIMATAFRSRHRPEHRMFCSLLVSDGFPAPLAARVRDALAGRDVFGDRARALVERCEADRGLREADGMALIGECVGRIFAWTGRGGPVELYRDLVAADLRIAADIACFPTHHLNHLACNSLAIDLFTAAMRLCLAERDADWFRGRATGVLSSVAEQADDDRVRLLLPWAPAALPPARGVAPAAVAGLVERLVSRLGDDTHALHRLPHAGFKETTEGPPADVPVLLRQDSYRALTERVLFSDAGGETEIGSHTARFGEVEQRGYACSVAGRRAYDAGLVAADAAGTDPGSGGAGAAFAGLGRTATELFTRGQILGRYQPSAAGLAARHAGHPLPTPLPALLAAGFVTRQPLRYEDFLPVSAAGIFASNLRQQGTGAMGAPAPPRQREELEAILGQGIIDPVAAEAATEAASIRETLAALGIAAADPQGCDHARE